MRARLGAVLLLLLGAAPLAAQQRPPAPRRDTVRSPADTGRARRDLLPRAPGDSAARDTLAIEWLATDSVMQALLDRPGYSRTRYQGDSLTFDARTRALEVRAGDSLSRVAVQRDSQLVVSDSIIRYNDSTGLVRVNGRPGGLIVLRTPGQSDVIVRGGFAEYNLRAGLARLANATFSAEEAGETWFIAVDTSAVLQPDSAARTRNEGPTLYGRGGTLTTCSEKDHPRGPHYHFEFRTIKQNGQRGIFARPAILYVYDVPVLWLPFVFQDLRRGRRSGILTPRFGLTDIIRNNPGYRRQIEDLGYYWTLNDYMDAQVGFDWRSGTGGDDQELDPGFVRFKGEWRYRWLNRFLSGEFASDHTRQRDGRTNTAYSWRHQQEFSRNSTLTANLNYVTSTDLQRQNTFNPYATLATISSSLNYQHKLGPARLSIGGTQKQYPGREQVERTLPTLNLSTSPVKVGEWLTWTPSFSFTESRILKSDQAGASSIEYRLDENGEVQLDSTGAPQEFRRLGNSRTSVATFDTPLQIFGWDFRNSFRFGDIQNDFPRTNRVYVDINDTATVERTYARTFRSDFDWTPSFTLPSLSQGRWNLTPSISLQNVDPSPLAVRTELSGGRWVTQTKRPSYSLGIAPTFFGLFPGFGPFSRFRHAFSPTLSWSYAPEAEVSDDFLRAIGRTRAGYLGSLRQNALSFGLSTNLEGKVRSAADSTPDAGEKLKLLSVQFQPLTYDFERLKLTESSLTDPARRQTGFLRALTSERWGYTLTSDLLPGVQFGADYSLFEGSPATSDTARFDPYLERVSASFSVSQENNPFAVLSRVFGRAVNRPATPEQGTLRPQPGDTLARRFANQPVAGSGRRNVQQLLVPPTKGWQASVGFSYSQQRPVTGNVIETDPFLVCTPLRGQPEYDRCVAFVRSNPSAIEPIPNTTFGGPIVRQPPQTTVQASTSLALSRYWSASWNTTYDFRLSEFASHVVTLQRELHDWNAIFAFTQAPNGNFAFNFFIALKAQPELKLDYNRATYRAGERR